MQKYRQEFMRREPKLARFAEEAGCPNVGGMLVEGTPP